MNIPLTITLLLTTVLFSCGPGNESDKTAAINTLDTTSEIKTPSMNGCYLMSIGKDSAYLKITTESTTVKGTLSYKRFEKDSNNGVVEGKVNNDIIRLWYRFQSEGVVSFREVYFKIMGDKLAEGYGDMEMRHDSAFFTLPNVLRYEENHPYVKVSCRE